MGEIDRIQQINPALTTTAAPLRVGNDSRRRQQEPEQEKKEDQLELTNELEPAEVSPQPEGPTLETPGIDIAI